MKKMIIKKKRVTKGNAGVRQREYYEKELAKKPKKPYTHKTGDEKPKDMSEEEYEKVRRGDSKLYERVWSKKNNRPTMRIKHSMGRTDIRRPKQKPLIVKKVKPKQ